MSTQPRSPLLRVNRKHPCAVCKRDDWCSYWQDGHGAICTRVKSGSPTRDGQSWMHFFDAAPAPKRAPSSKQKPIPAVVERAPVARRHAVYSALLDALTLSSEHRESLERRGLSRAEIDHLQFKSVPPAHVRAEIARQLARRFDLCALPGFSLASAEWRWDSSATGFFIPYRNEHGQIEGLQIRRWPHATGGDKYIWLSSKDKPGGASSGAPVHFAKPELLARAEEVLITEGGLKASIISFFTQSPVIAAAGVCNFGMSFGARLRSLFPALRRAVIAFDRDVMEKPQVHHALMSLTAQLERERFIVRFRTWPTTDKGYDDYLLAQLARKGRAA